MGTEVKRERPHGVYDASEAIQLTQDTMAERSAALLDNRAIANLTGIKEIDEYIVPWWPGDYIFTEGGPSNGKSYTSRMFHLRILRMLMNVNDMNRVTAWVTTEESVEKVTAHWLSAISGISSTEMLSGKLSRVHSVTMNAAVAEVSSWPIFLIGHTLGNHGKRNGVNTSARLSMEDIEACLDYIVEEKRKDLVYTTIDYMHRIRKPINIYNREEHMRTVVDWGRDIANKFAMPLNMVAQAKFAVSERSVPIPTLYDIEWTANAGQSADAILSVFMPKTKPDMQVLNFGEWHGIQVEPDMMILYVAKQKEGDGQKSFLLRVKPHLMKWELLEEATEYLNPQEKQSGNSKNNEYVNEWYYQQQEVPF